MLRSAAENEWPHRVQAAEECESRLNVTRPRVKSSPIAAEFTFHTNAFVRAVGGGGGGGTARATPSKPGRSSGPCTLGATTG